VTAGLPCPEARALLDESLDRALSAGESRALEVHLRECPACRAEAAAARRVHEALAGASLPDPGPAFTDRVVAALDRGPRALPREPLPRRAARWTLSALATAAVAAAAVLVLPGTADAAGLDGLLLPGLGDAVPALAPGTGDLLLRAGTLLPPWAAAAAACAAGALLAVEVAVARRRPAGRP